MHRPKSYYVKISLVEFLENQRDIQEATAAYEEYLRSCEKAISLEDIKKDLDIE